MIEKLVLVALGGAVGASARFLVVNAALRVLGPAFPWGTLIVNVLGSVAMGMVVTLLVERVPAAGDRLAPLVMTGVLGGFTTFSAFSLDAIQLIERERWLAVTGYVTSSVLLSIIGLALGMMLTRAAIS
ncbi:fluoride efflux transporter CrcB [Limibaculum sp. M0105]|uniref:Fluoride-specific ion channel FluC n=1 Tax=Thermohalobaculum xanthum TaxID=2753746 RepID=A0A8J7M9F8_9RHOB|nr:fluoride efflux transporter CrcB [Thermohalobaculum xanthum]MBK0401171.1 fluoride efflux transporter CrcB [Thermohalobaculum xanthum]